MIKLTITDKFEEHLEELRQGDLYHRIEYAFNTLWYDSPIPDDGSEALRKSCDLIFPKDTDDDIMLQAKGFLIQGMSKMILDIGDETGDASCLEVDACVIPDMNRDGMKVIMEKQKKI